jgi:hypothetical protein
MGKTREALLSMTAAWVVVMAGFACLVSCGKKEETPPAAAVVKVEVPNAEEALSAMLRGHPNSKRICIDGQREQAFFLDYGPLPKDAADRQLFNGGWLFIEKVEFYKTSNNSWFITNQEDKKYIQVYPDVTGLNCRVQ